MNKLLILSLAVAVASVSGEDQVCEPGKAFQDYCNTCSCSNDGKTFACTLMFCDENIWNKDGTLKSNVTETSPEPEEPQKCQQGEEVKYYCNTCTCGKDNTLYACTLMACDESIWNEDGSLKAGAETTPESTQLDFTTKDSEKPKKVCKPGTEFKEYCNTCFCGKDGILYACTDIACDQSVFNKDGSLKTPAEETTEASEVEVTTIEAPKLEKVCEPLAEFKEYCNDCTCSKDGTFYACTLKLCDENVWNKDGSLKIDLEATTDAAAADEKPTETPNAEDSTKADGQKICEPGEEIAEACQKCTCSNDGLSKSCTSTCSEDKPAQSRRKRYVEELECAPSEQFKSYCNTCVCSNDGMSKACTMHRCPDFYNEDGSINVDYSGLLQFNSQHARYYRR